MSYLTGSYLFFCTFILQILTFGSIDSVCSKPAAISTVPQSSHQMALTASDLSGVGHLTSSYLCFCSFMLQKLTFGSIGSVCLKPATISNLRQLDCQTALTNDLCYVSYLTPLSNAQCGAFNLCNVNCCCPVDERYTLFCTPIFVPHLECNHFDITSIPMCHAEHMLHLSMCAILSKMKAIFLSMLHQFSGDSIIVKLLLHVLEHGYHIGCQCLYVDNNPSDACAMLSLAFKQGLCSQHDFKALKACQICKLARSRGMQLLAFVHFFFEHFHQKKVGSSAFVQFWLNRQPFLLRHCIGQRSLSMCNMNTGSKIKNIKTTDNHLKSSGHNFGGGGGRLYDFSVISDYLVSDAACVSAESKFRYVAHVDNAALLEYPLSQYVHTRIPITGLLEFLPLMHC